MGWAAFLNNPCLVTDLGDLHGNALIWYFTYKTTIRSGDLAKLPMVAIYNGGGIRASIPIGNILQGNIVTVSPIGNW